MSCDVTAAKVKTRKIHIFICDGGTHLKALYIGRYQQTKEQGVKRRAQRMARPKPTPPVLSTQNMAREEIRFNRSVPVQTRRW